MPKIGYKQLIDNKGNTYICKLMVPETATIFDFFNKFRASKVFVLFIYRAEINDKGKIIRGKKVKQVTHNSWHYDFIPPKTIYRTGRTTYPDFFDPRPNAACSHGIHFCTKDRITEWFLDSKFIKNTMRKLGMI